MSVFTIDYSQDKFSLGRNTIILGGRGKGKTNLVLTNIFLKFHSKINHLFVVSQDEKYREATDYIFQEKHFLKIFEEIQALDRNETKLLIIDEIKPSMYPIVESILINSHYFNITVIIVSQTARLSMIMKNYIVNAVISSDGFAGTIRNFYESFGLIYGNYNHFLEVVSGLGKNEFLFLGRNNVAIVRTNDHWLKYLYSYKMQVRYDVLKKIHDDNKHLDLLAKVNIMINELEDLKKRLENNKN